MKLLVFIWYFVSLFTLAFANSPPYFIINEPSKTVQWGNNITNFATWTIDAGSEVSVFDVELGRLSMDGLHFIARNVPVNAPGLPVMLQNVPSGDDYYLIFLNVTHSLIYSVSERFSILSSGNTASNPSKPPSVKKRDQFLATVTISGAPNPTATFAHTFDTVSSGHRVIVNSYRLFCWVLISALFTFLSF